MLQLHMGRDKDGQPGKMSSYQGGGSVAVEHVVVGIHLYARAEVVDRLLMLASSEGLIALCLRQESCITSYFMLNQSSLYLLSCIETCLP